MSNKQISQLDEATSVNVSDLFVLEQSGAAMRLSGQTLINKLAEYLEGKGGITSITKISSVGLVDTYQIDYADTDAQPTTFTVTNGQNGTNGTNGQDGTDGVSPTITSATITGGHRLTITDADGTTIVDVMNGNDGQDGTNGVNGVTFTPSVSAAGVISWTNDGGRVNPPSVNIKGDTGAAGAATYTYIKWADNQPTADADMGDIPSDWMGIYVGSSSTAPTHYTDYEWYKVKGETGDAGEDGESIGSVVWLSNSSGDPQGTAGTTDTYQVKLSDNTVVGTFEVTNGLNGSGLVESVCGIAPVNGDVPLTPTDIGAATIPLHISTTITTSPATISNAAITSTMRVVSVQFGTPSVILKDVAWTTSNGSLVLGDASTFSSSTTVDIILAETT